MRRFLAGFARRIATDPKLREDLSALYRKAEPHMRDVAREARAAVSEADPRRDPKGFARAVKDRVRAKLAGR